MANGTCRLKSPAEKPCRLTALFNGDMIWSAGFVELLSVRKTRAAVQVRGAPNYSKALYLYQTRKRTFLTRKTESATRWTTAQVSQNTSGWSWVFQRLQWLILGIPASKVVDIGYSSDCNGWYWVFQRLQWVVLGDPAIALVYIGYSSDYHGWYWVASQLSSPLYTVRNTVVGQKSVTAVALMLKYRGSPRQLLIVFRCS